VAVGEGGVILGSPGCVLDNSVVSALHQAGALARLLEMWPGRWVVPAEVREEASRWKAEGHRVVVILDSLEARGIIVYAEVDPSLEGALMAQLSRTLGQGESAAIAMAYRRGFQVALDDRAARRTCERLQPSVEWVSTESLLVRAVAEGKLTRAEATAIWNATGILDIRRGLSWDN